MKRVPSPSIGPANALPSTVTATSRATQAAMVRQGCRELIPASFCGERRVKTSLLPVTRRLGDIPTGTTPILERWPCCQKQGGGRLRGWDSHRSRVGYPPRAGGVLRVFRVRGFLREAGPGFTIGGAVPAATCPSVSGDQHGRTTAACIREWPGAPCDGGRSAPYVSSQGVTG